MNSIMKNPILYFAILFCFQIHAQVGIGTTTPHESSILDVESTDKGILIPRLTTAERDAIAPPADGRGLLVYNTDTSTFWYFDGAIWIELKTDFEGWLLEGNAGTNPSTNFVGTTDNQPLNFRVNNIRAGHISENNIFFGMSSGVATTNYGPGNTGIGHETLKVNIDGKRNAAFGYQTLQANTSGNDNVAVGYQALFNNTNGDGNTASGAGALYRNTTGDFNVANGYQALHHNTIGNNNVANGYEALKSNTTGNYNVANGYRALRNNTTGSNNIANGNEALSNNISGGNNVANGYRALFNNTTGTDNVANGTRALQANIDGSKNTAYGNDSMKSNRSGVQNVAVGFQSLFNNDNGEKNVAVGYRPLNSNLSGEYNIAIGLDALYNNEIGVRNIAIGGLSLFNNVADNNVAVGHGALHANITGKNNTALGASTNVLSPNLENTVAIGYNARVGANDAIAIGNRAIAHGENSMALGNGAVVHDDNRIRLGNNGVNWIGGNSAWHNTSDARFKYQVENDVPGLAFITKLKPATYYMDNDKLDEFSKTGNIGTAWSDTEGKVRQTGFLAQEVERVAQEIGYEFDGVNKPQNDRDNYTLAYSTFVVPLVKAVQEQQALIESQNARIAELEAQRKELAEVVENQQTQIDSIHQRLDTFFVADKD